MTEALVFTMFKPDVVTDIWAPRLSGPLVNDYIIGKLPQRRFVGPLNVPFRHCQLNARDPCPLRLGARYKNHSRKSSHRIVGVYPTVAWCWWQHWASSFFLEYTGVRIFVLRRRKHWASSDETVGIMRFYFGKVLQIVYSAKRRISIWQRGHQK